MNRLHAEHNAQREADADALGRTERDLQPGRPALPLPEAPKRDGVNRDWQGAAPFQLFQGLAARLEEAVTAYRAVPLSRSPSLESALPRLFCVVAQSSGTRSRVLSSSATW
jgi:hypothetical protein